MDITFITKSKISKKTDAEIYLVDADLKITNALSKLNKNDYINDAIKKSKHFDWNWGEHVHITAPVNCNANHVFIISLGNKKESSHISNQHLGGKIADLLNFHKCDSSRIIVDDNGLSCINSLLSGIKLKNYIFDKYYTVKKKDHKLSLSQIEVAVDNHNQVEKEYQELNTICEGIAKTRELVAEPANILSPEEFMHRCQELENIGVHIKVLYKSQMEELGMNALLGVAQGSINEPYTVIMEWKPEKPKKTIALAGKGVCFDSGGLNIKSAASNIADMKDDMGGAATVFGTIYSAAKQKLDNHIIGIIGLVENMTSGSAQRPSDVVKSMSGQTIEVENTDAEGRLVLADIMWYVQQHYDPDYLIDIATLTGAVVVALGEGGYAGMFANDEKLANTLLTLSKETGELLWRLPLDKHYDQQLDSEIEDMRNTGTVRGGGATIAAQFLQRFVTENRKWAHLDIANVAWNKRGTPISPKGATGFGVALLYQFIKEIR